MHGGFLLPITLCLLLFLGTVSAGCIDAGHISESSAVSPDNIQVSPSVPAESGSAQIPAVQNVVDANNHFAFDLYRKIKDDPVQSQKNILFSPFSISSALAITGEGARGKTAEEIGTVFHFPANKTTMRQEYSDLLRALRAVNDNETTLQLANALWAERSHPFLTEYTQTADQYYSAKTTNLDIQNDPDRSLEIMNRWVEGKTNGKIRNLLLRSDIDPNTTRLIITNTLSFTGKWEKPFGDTQTGPFRISQNETVNAPMMFRSIQAVFNYNETPDMQVIELPYRSESGHRISMLIFLPRNNDLPAVERAMTAEKLDTIRRSMAEQNLGYILLPKFSYETRYRLPETLTSMGMPRAFMSDADFSGMDGNRNNLHIDTVIHKAFIAVHEQGTEASAATAVSMKSQGEHRNLLVFHADHPFIFIIQDRDTGIILFMGRMMNPNEPPGN